jgi:two-component system chemotaxis response regulator CheY
MRILLVDDSPAMRAFIRRVLTLTGVAIGECYEASNGLEALQELELHPVDVVLCDINMPVMDGEQFVTELHRLGKLESTAVLIVSTDSTCTRMRRLLDIGARGYLQKPFTPELLRDALDQVIPHDPEEVNSDV